MISTQVRAADVGVVTPYAAQARLVREKVDAAVEVASVDAFQGREKEVVVVSTVRANAGGDVGFLSDWRRGNVALTRARRALVVVGHAPTLLREPLAWGPGSVGAARGLRRRERGPGRGAGAAGGRRGLGLGRRRRAARRRAGGSGGLRRGLDEDDAPRRRRRPPRPLGPGPSPRVGGRLRGAARPRPRPRPRPPRLRREPEPESEAARAERLRAKHLERMAKHREAAKRLYGQR